MSRYTQRKLIMMLPTVFIAVTLVFFLFHLGGGDTARIIAGDESDEEVISAIRHRLGLDQPLYIQYARYLRQLVRGDLGLSLITGQPVAQQIKAMLPATLELAVAGMVLALLVGTTTGIASALRRNSLIDYISRFVAVSGICVPNFWIGLTLMLVFSAKLRWLPSTGRQGWQIGYVVMPMLTLSARLIAIIARLLRSSILEVMHEDYVRTARAKGLKERIVILRHVLRNAMIPMVTVAGLQFGSLLGGTVVVETVFSWPGLGLALTTGVSTRDYTLVQGIAVVYVILFLVVNLMVDLSYAYLDPRIRYD